MYAPVMGDDQGHCNLEIRGSAVLAAPTTEKKTKTLMMKRIKQAKKIGKVK